MMEREPGPGPIKRIPEIFRLNRPAGGPRARGATLRKPRQRWSPAATCAAKIRFEYFDRAQGETLCARRIWARIKSLAPVVFSYLQQHISHNLRLTAYRADATST